MWKLHACTNYGKAPILEDVPVPDTQPDEIFWTPAAPLWGRQRRTSEPPVKRYHPDRALLTISKWPNQRQSFTVIYFPFLETG
jgi:hypothetical protein